MSNTCAVSPLCTCRLQVERTQDHDDELPMSVLSPLCAKCPSEWLESQIAVCCRPRCAWEKADPQNPWYSQYLSTVSPEPDFRTCHSENGVQGPHVHCHTTLHPHHMHTSTKSITCQTFHDPRPPSITRSACKAQLTS